MPLVILIGAETLDLGAAQPRVAAAATAPTAANAPGAAASAGPLGDLPEPLEAP